MKIDFTFQKIYHNSVDIITNSLCTAARLTYIARIVDLLATEYPIGRFTQMGLYSIGILGLMKMAKDRPIATALTVLGLRLFNGREFHYTENQFKKLFYEGYQFPKSIKAPPIELLVAGPRGFQGIPEGVEVAELKIFRNNSSSLPKNLKAKTIKIIGCDSFRETPEGMEYDTLVITGCKNFANLRRDLKTKFIKIEYCQSFQETPEDMECDTLEILNCENFANLSANLKVKELYLKKCPSLRAIPAGMHIEQTMSITRCYELQEIGAPSFLGGNVDLQRCRNITRLPALILQLPQLPEGSIRQVNLTGTGITEDQIQALGRLTGMRLFTSQQAARVNVEFSSLAQLLIYWRKEAGYDGKEFTIELRPDQLDGVLKYGAGLRNTSDYKDENIRAFLAKRVVSVFVKMSENETIKEAALFHINQGLISCDDRIIDALDDIEQMILLHDASTMDKIALRKLGKGFFFLGMVQKKAQEHVAAILGKKGWVDELDVHLRFKIGLKERFHLPIQTHGMIFSNLAFITDEELQAIGDKIAKEGTEEMFEAFLASWVPWRQFSIPSYEDLEEAPDYRMDPDVLCVISQQPPENPVLCHGNIYDYDFLKKWFLTSNQDPATRQLIVWKDIKRVP